MARVGVVTFPGTNCDRETLRAFASVPGVEVVPIWHKTEAGEAFDLVVLPGGFSYGDYLRPGAIARFSPVMRWIVEFAHAGGYVLGICNGFQILTEAGLLPGALIRNRGLRFLSRSVTVRVERQDTPWTCRCEVGQVLRLPIAHGDGNFVHHDEDFRKLDSGGQVLLRYVAGDGTLDGVHNVNGSLGAAAGVVNSSGNVFGLMPHPERAADARLGSADGRWVLESIADWIAMHGREAPE